MAATLYYTLGDKILGENRSGEKIRYLYDGDYLIGFVQGIHYYKYVLDSQGNVAMITDYAGKNVLAVYEYDAFGHCKIYDSDCNEITDENAPGLINPMRWRGMYYDTETGLYYTKGNYYDPDTGAYLNASPISEALNGAFLPRSIDRHGLMCNNIVEYSNAERNGARPIGGISSFTMNMLLALPRIPQAVSIVLSMANNTVSLSPYVQSAAYMVHNELGAGMMRFNKQLLLPSKLAKFVDIAAYGFVAIDTILDIYNNVQQNKSVEYTIASAVYTAVTGIGIVWLSTEIGAVIAAPGGPVLTILGAIMGLLFGLYLAFVSNLIKEEIFK